MLEDRGVATTRPPEAHTHTHTHTNERGCGPTKKFVAERMLEGGGVAAFVPNLILEVMNPILYTWVAA